MRIKLEYNIYAVKEMTLLNENSLIWECHLIKVRSTLHTTNRLFGYEKIKPSFKLIQSIFHLETLFLIHS